MSTYKTNHKAEELIGKAGTRINFQVNPNAKYTIPASKSGVEKDQTLTPGRENFSNFIRATYTGINKKSMMQFILDYEECRKIRLKGMAGYKHGGKEMDKLCNALYGQPKYGIKAHNMKERELSELPDGIIDTSDSAEIWLSTPFCDKASGIFERPGEYYGVKSVQYGGVREKAWLTTTYGEEQEKKMWIWPVLWIPTHAWMVQYTSPELGISGPFLFEQY